MLFSIMNLGDTYSPKSGGNKNKYLEELIKEIGKGSITAFEDLYKETDSAIYGFALSILKNPQEAEDIMHDAYLKIYESANRYKALGKPMAWILTIVRNLALSKFRRKEEQTLSLEDWHINDSHDFTEGTIDKIILEKILRYLKDDESQIVVLHCITGLKHKEIAEILDLPLSTAISKYHRSLAKLKKILRREVK